MYQALSQIIGAIDRELYRHLPPMYIPGQKGAPAFDIHVGLMVTNALIQEIVEPILAEAVLRIDKELRNIEEARDVELRPFMEHDVKPAVQKMVDAILKAIPGSFQGYAPPATPKSAQGRDDGTRRAGRKARRKASSHDTGLNGTARARLHGSSSENLASEELSEDSKEDLSTRGINRHGTPVER